MELLESRYKEELDVALNAAEKAGKKIDEYARDGFKDWNKEDGSKVTEADLEAQKIIVEKIRESFPQDGFLGEEEDLSPEGQDRIWIIDPIDGTFNFGKGLSDYCVSIALEVDGNIEVGVVLSPETGRNEVFFTIRDYGAYRNGNEEDLDEALPIRISNEDQMNESLFFCTFFNIYDGELELEEKVIESFARKGATHRQLGSAALELCGVASGSAEFLYNPIMKKWDYAAGKLIVEEAGGKVDVETSDFPNSYHVTASNEAMQDEVSELVLDARE